MKIILPRKKSFKKDREQFEKITALDIFKKPSDAITYLVNAIREYLKCDNFELSCLSSDDHDCEQYEKKLTVFRENAGMCTMYCLAGIDAPNPLTAKWFVERGHKFNEFCGSFRTWDWDENVWYDTICEITEGRLSYLFQQYYSFTHAEELLSKLKTPTWNWDALLGPIDWTCKEVDSAKRYIGDSWKEVIEADLKKMEEYVTYLKSQKL